FSSRRRHTRFSRDWSSDVCSPICYLLGVNCRDLRELTVDFARFARLAPQLPRDIPAVAESGVDSASLASRVAELGYRVALVGTRSEERRVGKECRSGVWA